MAFRFCFIVDSWVDLTEEGLPRLPITHVRFASKSGNVCSFSDQMPKFFITFDEVDQLGV